MIGRRFLRALRAGFPQVFQNMDLHSEKAKAATISVFYFAQPACSAARVSAGGQGERAVAAVKRFRRLWQTRGIPPYCP